MQITHQPLYYPVDEPSYYPVDEYSMQDADNSICVDAGGRSPYPQLSSTLFIPVLLLCMHLTSQIVYSVVLNILMGDAPGNYIRLLLHHMT